MDFPCVLKTRTFKIYFFKLLRMSLNNSIIGMMHTAIPIDIAYSIRLICSKPKAFDRKGMYITAVVNKSESAIAPHRTLLWPFILNTDCVLDLMLNEWKISVMERVRNAIVMPSALEAISQTPDSIKCPVKYAKSVIAAIKIP